MRLARVASLIAIVVLSAALPAVAADGWQTFRDPEGVFSFDAPGTVSISTKAGVSGDGLPVLLTFYAYRPDARHQSGCIVTKEQITSGKEMRDDAVSVAAVVLKDRLAATGIRPDWDTDIVLDGQKGHRLDFRNIPGQRVSFRWFKIGKSLYNFLCTAEPDASDAQIQENERVTKSLRFLVH